MPFIPLSQVQPQPVDWLWPRLLARDHTHLLDGDPGRGKSTMTFDLIARLTTGRPMPDGAPAAAPMSVVLLNAEDSARDTVRPRLAAAGADVDRVLIWETLPGEPVFRLPSRVEELAAVVREHAAGLVVIDPVLAYLDPAVNIGSDPSVRQALAPLQELARSRHCAIMMQRHLNKTGGPQALYRGLASIAFIAAVRIAWVVGPDPKVPGQFVLAQSKNNLGPLAPSLGYRIISVADDLAQIEWLGPSPWYATDLVGTNPAKVGAVQRAADFVKTFLRDGPRRGRDVIAAARAQGLAKITTQRAARFLQIRYQRVVRSPHDHTTYWLLPGQEMPARVLPEGVEDLTSYFQEMEAYYAAAALEPQAEEKPREPGTDEKRAE
jgi:hypothetical protein